MDGSTIEHSDSDSGESWTLVENNIPYADDAPDFPENTGTPSERENVKRLPSDKDDDTDGISIISDSDPESIPCDKCVNEEFHTTEHTPLISIPTTNDYDTVPQETDYLGDNIKYKTYVHKRNPKVGTILDIIMLGTFVITAGMALGHLWSCKNECTTQTSVNKILSNLYKLQEENAYLRNKLKEITLATGYPLPAHKFTTEKINSKQHRCKKIFEEPLITNRKIEGGIKCADDKSNIQDPLLIPEHEKEFLNDLNKMKNIYDENKIWLKKEVKKQLDKFAEENNVLSTAEPSITMISHKQINLKKQLGPIQSTHHKKDAKVVQDTERSIVNESQNQFYPAFKVSEILESSDDTNVKTEPYEANNKIQTGGNEEQLLPKTSQEKKITYADSLKTDHPLQRSKRSESIPSRFNRDYITKRKHKDDDVLLNFNSFSDDDIKKDDRYTGLKMKYDRKKHDRQKSHKKQKRNNKYEQWEMKGGYLRDYDELSTTSFQDIDNNFIHNPDKKFLNPDFENYINKLAIIENNASSKDQPKTTKKFDDKAKADKRSLKNDKGKKLKVKDSEWFDKRTALRAEARMKLEHELFGENTSNNAAWYFRRMQKREQCRAQKDNSTFKKLSKRKMNFKMKR